MSKLIDLTGQRFGRLVVLERSKIRKSSGEAYWFCKCDCGGYTTVSGYHLRQGHIVSCGCYKNERSAIAKTKNEVGNRYGKLTVIEYAGRNTGTKNGGPMWKCLCDCGNYCEVSANALRGGHTSSCGCLRGSSKGELYIEQYLKNKNISYKSQYSFKGLYGEKKSFLLKFDFYLPDYNTCIEFQGLQHFKSIDFFGGEEYFIIRQKNDNKKKEYCEKHNIGLLYITYEDNIEKCLDNFFNEKDKNL